ncbi:DUF4097 family beta strand repeat-containing protein [Streptomyces sp. UNOC14_S4]|uniref:DUF4097 family beta strand repeat-containing protein n=1 Tax=Streptomyces sp. UNOC14_S4 TaxID=2872340 RepID=UPI001E5FB01C|nr:DUF4097 family beta strand repeat-containing protein [Streptomyces sp. UNOC14_S4]MCC3767174.1 DUF4097 domain-containing protein [Streptomyces sp. UNOC14_S4]
MFSRRYVLLPAVVATGLLLAGCSDSGSVKSTTADAQVKEKVNSVEISGARRGTVVIKAGDGPEVSIHRTVHYRDDAEPKPTQHVSDGALTFTRGCDNCYIDYELTVPASVQVKVSSSSGKVDVRGVAAADVKTSSGAVTVASIAGVLNVGTSSGSITGTGLSGPSAKIGTYSGDTKLDFTKAPGEVSTDSTSGSVRLKVPGGPYRVEVRGTSGKREINIPTDPSAKSALKFKATSGDIEVSAA